MEEAVSRLQVAQPQQNVYFILGVGIRWMVFEWAPGDSGGHSHGDSDGAVWKQLYIKADSYEDNVYPACCAPR